MTLRTSPPRLSLRILMALIAVFALGLGAMKTGSSLVTIVSFWILLLGLLVGMLMAFVRRPSTEWFGFSLFGWTLAILLFVVPVQADFDLCDSPPFDWVGRVAHTLHPLPSGGDAQLRVPLVISSPPQRSGLPYGSSRMSSLEFPQRFEATPKNEDLGTQIHNRRKRATLTGEAFLTLAFACLGALLGRFVAPSPITLTDSTTSV